jgi:hypothetical protein
MSATMTDGAPPAAVAALTDAWLLDGVRTPLGATGVRLAITLAHRPKRSGTRYGIASACIGAGQGFALLIENPAANAAQ